MGRIDIWIRDKKVIFVTNNATKSRKTYKGKFDHLGVQAHVVCEITCTEFDTPKTVLRTRYTDLLMQQQCISPL